MSRPNAESSATSQGQQDVKPQTHRRYRIGILTADQRVIMAGESLSQAEALELLDRTFDAVLVPVRE